MLASLAYGGNVEVLAMADQVLYDDGLVKLDRDGLTIRRYYFPLGTSKRIRYDQIRGVQMRHMGAFTGKGRLWGTGDFQHWFPWDSNRPRKDKALILDVGRRIRPVITPDDPDRVLAILQERTLRR
jgi:hypothetical protein